MRKVFFTTFFTSSCRRFSQACVVEKPVKLGAFDHFFDELSSLEQKKCVHYSRYEAYAAKFRYAYTSLERENFGYSSEAILAAKKQIIDRLSEKKDQKLSDESENEAPSSNIPISINLMESIANSENGMKFLCDLRRDVGKRLADKQDNPQTETGKPDHDLKIVKNFDQHLLNILKNQLDLKSFRVEQVLWDTHSADFLEKIMKGEKVHPFSDFADLKRRLVPYRRLFTLTHSSMSKEPLVVLHVALTGKIAKTTESILNHEIKPNEEENLHKVNAIMFYAISAIQPGLQGIDLGSLMLQKAVDILVKKYPKVSNFCTISPIPGFNAWLSDMISVASIDTDDKSVSLPARYLRNQARRLDGLSIDTQLESLKEELFSFDWVHEPSRSHRFSSLLTPLCAYYLIKVKNDHKAFDPVCNFHMKNGAEIYRLNVLAEKSEKFLKQSCGMMVNYKYVPDAVARNSEAYQTSGFIRVDESFTKLVEKLENESKFDKN